MNEQEIHKKILEINEKTTNLDANKQPWKQIVKFFSEVWVYFNEKFILAFQRNINLNTAEGLALEEQAAHWVGVNRHLGVKTQGKAYFAVSKNVNIPKDLIISSPSGIKFKVQEALYVESPGEEVNIEALTPGFDSNLKAIGTILTSERALNGLDSITLRENWITQTGKDEEDDESLRKRVRTTLASQAGGDISAKYVARALQVEGVRDAVVWPIPRGAGSADLVIASHDGEVTPKMLNEVSKYLNEWGLINWDIHVIAARKQRLSLKIFIKDANICQESIQEKVNQYMTSLKIGDIFRIKDLYSALSYNVNILKPLTDVQAKSYYEWIADITFSDEQGTPL